jgi:hypothetical protein
MILFVDFIVRVCVFMDITGIVIDLEAVAGGFIDLVAIIVFDM